MLIHPSGDTSALFVAPDATALLAAYGEAQPRTFLLKLACFYKILSCAGLCFSRAVVFS